MKDRPRAVEFKHVEGLSILGDGGHQGGLLGGGGLWAVIQAFWKTKAIAPVSKEPSDVPFKKKKKKRESN